MFGDNIPVMVNAISKRPIPCQKSRARRSEKETSTSFSQPSESRG